MRLRGKEIFVGLAFLVLPGAALAARPDGMRVNAVRVERPPSIDGELNDSAWMAASAGGGKAVVDIAHTGDALTAYPRVAYIAHDGTNFYVALSIPIPASDRLVKTVTTDGGALWEDDEIELFIQPAGLDTYRHLGMNAAGAITTESGDGQAWLANVAGVSKVDGARWVIELSIPFTDIGVVPRAGEIWGFNLTGHQVGPGELWITWNPTYGAFNNPDRFGELVFK